jgi:pyruvate ferredoxin oxidoreductase delta subunit
VKEKKDEKKMSAKELPVGDILEAGSAKHFKTGDWKTERPVWNQQKCIHCLSCWIACPDSAIKVKDGKITGIDMEHCKGCGICARECPVKISAIVMEKEKK